MPDFDLDRLFRPRSIAVLGATEREGAYGRRPLENLLACGYAGALYPINPRYESVLGVPCLGSIAEAPGPVDLAFIATARERVEELLLECAAAGVGAAIVPAAGYSDGGPEGAEAERRLAAIAREHGIALNGPNNMGFVNMFEGAAVWPATLARAKPGPVALVSQSGSIGIAVSQDERDLGVGYMVTCGNEAVLTAADYLSWFAAEPRVRVILLFLETIRDPAGFAAAARKAHANGKRLVALKVGASESGRRAVAAHTGALAGEGAVYDAFFRRLGIAVVREFDSFLEEAALLCAFPEPPRTPHLVPACLSGGEAALLADLAAGMGASVPELSPATVAALRPAYPPFSKPRNPLDAYGLGWDAKAFGTIVGALHADTGIGAVGMFLDAAASVDLTGSYHGEMAEICARLPAGGPPFVFVNNTAQAGLNPGLRETVEGLGFPYLQGMRPALAAMTAWAAMRPPVPPPAPDPRAAQLRTALAAAAGDAARFALLREAGVPMAPCRAVASEDEAVAEAAALGGTTVLKATVPGLLHKTERGLVRLGLAGEEAVRAGFRELAAATAGQAGAEITVQPMVGPGVELILGARFEPGFGPVLAVGPGGTLVELAGKAAVDLAPVDEARAREMLRETPAARLLAGMRGAGPFDEPAAVAAIVAFSRLVHALGDAVKAIEVNPLIVLEKGALGVDVAVEV